MTDIRTSSQASAHAAARRPGRTPPSGLKSSLTRGQAALAFVAVSCVCVLGVLGIHHWRVAQQEASRDVASQAATLKWARGAVDAFAAWHGRLPCAAAEMGGAEDCSIANGKGWLPVQTLMAVSSGGGGGTPDDHPDLGANLAIRYVAYRNTAGRDLAVKTQHGAVNVSMFATDKVNGFDLCGKVGQVGLQNWRVTADAGSDKGFAYSYKKPGEAPVNIAYGLAVSATGEAFSELNAGSDPGIESPNRPRDGSYRDVTEVVPFDQLFGRLGCGAGLAGAYAVSKAEDYWKLAVGDKARSLVDYGMHRVHMGVGAAAYSAVAGVEAGGDITNETANIIKSILILTTAGHAPCPEIWHTLAVETVALGISTSALAMAAADGGVQGSYAVGSAGSQAVTAGMPTWLPTGQVSMSTTTNNLGLI